MKTSYQLVAVATTLLGATHVLAQSKDYVFTAPASDPDPAPTTVIVSVIEETPADVTVTIDAPPGGFPTYTPPPPPPPSSSAAAAPPPPANSPSSSAPSAQAAPSQSTTPIPTNGTHPACPGTCAMSVSFTGLNVPFAVGQGQANIMSGMTRDVCLCFQPGPTRAVIGTTDTGAMATLFEGSAPPPGPNAIGYLDVSFVQGFTYPMVCSGQTGATSGCSTDLYSVPGASCPGGGGTKMGEVCNNPQGPAGKRNPGAPPAHDDPTAYPWCQACSAPDAFFAPCAGGAYTYPYDDVAMASGTEISCCIGPECQQKEGIPAKTDIGNCEATARKDPCVPCPGTGSCGGGQTSRRSLEQVLENAVVEKRAERVGRRHRHHHGAAAGGFGHKH